VAAQQSGVFKTTDSAESWRPASVGLSGVVVGNVTVDPLQHQTLYAGTAQHGVYKSNDGGASWLPANNGLMQPIEAIAVDPTTPATLYAAATSGVFKSVDSGGAWFPSGSGITSHASMILVDPRQSTTLYAATETAVYKSVDSGQSWLPASNGLPEGFISDLAIDPQNSDRLLAARSGHALDDAIFITTDGGAEWTELDVGVSGIGSAVSFHPTFSATLYTGVTLGAFRGSFLKSADGGQTWTETNRGRSGSLTGAVAADPFLPGTAYAAAFPRIYKTVDHGENWTLTATLPAGVNRLALDPSHPDVLYAATGAGIFKSVDGGSNWTPANEGLTNLEVRSLGIDRRGKTLYAGTNEGVFRSDDSGTSWSATSALPDPFPIVWTLAVDPVHGRTVYARSDNGLAKTTDGGVSWTRLSAAPRYTAAIVIDPSQPNVLYAAADGGAFKSIDGGETWQAVNQGLPDQLFFGNQIAIDRSNPRTLYFSPFAGAFRTSDGGESWSTFSEGDLVWGFLVFGLAVNANGDTVYAATYGGVYSYRILPTSFYTLTPCRLVDTRKPPNGPALNAESERVFSLSGSCGIPPTARSVALNVTATQATTQGYLSVYETGIPAPETISIAYRAGQTRANNAIVALDPLGRLTVKCNQPSGSVHVILDVSGYFE
jgi:photosystem II stability/assembly factor-like uncharacterized protein